MNEITIMATGHRPDKLGGYIGYDLEFDYYISLRYILMYIIKYLCLHYEKVTIVSGLAAGVDTIWAEAGIRLKNGNDINKINNLSIIGISPFKDQEKPWCFAWKKRFNYIVENLDEYIIIGDHFHNMYYQQRNEQMVDISNIGVSIFDGSKGGTCNCVRYANKKALPLIQIDPGEILTIDEQELRKRIFGVISKIS